MAIKMYSTPTCPICKRAKEFFKNNKIKFTNIDVSSSKSKLKEMVEKSGQSGVPVFDIDGKILVGFNEGKFKK